MKNQMATTIEQSRRILACGMDSNTADMCFMGIDIFAHPYSGILAQWEGDSAMKGEYHTADDFDLTPAWSLSRLLELIPQRILAPHTDTPCDFILHHHPNLWIAMYHDGKSFGDSEDYMWQCCSESKADNPIEACVRMLEWIHINKYSLNFNNV